MMSKKSSSEFSSIPSSSRIFIAGHNGMVGSALYRAFQKRGYKNLIGISSKKLDLRNQAKVRKFFKKEKPEYVLLAAAKVGGIFSNNTYRADFIYSNIQIQNNLIYHSYLNNVKKLMFLGSSCIYPKDCAQPIKEEDLLSGNLEPTNEPYAIAKISGIKMCESFNVQHGTNYISVTPTNLYGPNDNYDLETSHVLPALLKKIHNGKLNNEPSIKIWGTGKVFREFLHVDDLASACLHIMENLDASKMLSMKISHINVGYGEEISIIELANLIKKIVRYEGDFVFDPSMPDGTLKKKLDCSRLKTLGWEPSINLEKGIKSTYKQVLKNGNLID